MYPTKKIGPPLPTRQLGQMCVCVWNFELQLLRPRAATETTKTGRAGAGARARQRPRARVLSTRLGARTHVSLLLPSLGRTLADRKTGSSFDYSSRRSVSGGRRGRPRRRTPTRERCSRSHRSIVRPDAIPMLNTRETAPVPDRSGHNQAYANGVEGTGGGGRANETNASASHFRES